MNHENSKPIIINRKRMVYFGLVVVTIGLGLLSRTSLTPKLIFPYIGDSLYALMMYWGIAFLWIKASPKQVFLTSILICIGIECSQLYQADWINAIRQHKVGRLILGQGFLWSDLLSYIVGGLVGFTLESWYYNR